MATIRFVTVGGVMSLSSPTRSDGGGAVAVAHHDHVAGAKAVYHEYVTESAAAYQKCLAGLAAVRAAEPSDTERAAAAGEPAAPYRNYPDAVREAGIPAIWTAGLTAARAAAAYYKFVTRLAAMRAADLADAQPPTEMSNADRTAAAAAESAAADQNGVEGPPAAQREAASPDGWSPAVGG
jgi:hypothetical protein